MSILPPDWQHPQMHNGKPLAQCVLDLSMELAEARADIERLKDYIMLCFDKFGKDAMPYDPTDTALIALLNEEGREDEQ